MQKENQKMSVTTKLELAVERSKYIFPTHHLYQQLCRDAHDVTNVFLDMVEAKLPKGYLRVLLGEDEEGSLLILCN